MEEILISACLLGRACRYDGQSKPNRSVQRFCEESEGEGVRWVPVCPEELGQLGTPRPAAELCGGDGQHVWDGAARVVRVVDGKDLTEAFRKGAERAHQAAPQAKLAILKARSPSCGVRQTSIDGRFQSGMGVFAALLKRAGIPVISDEDWSNQRGSSHTRKPKAPSK